MSVKTEDSAEFLLANADINGVACATVKDGHVLVFTEAALQGLLARVGADKKLVVFIKRPDMQG